MDKVRVKMIISVIFFCLVMGAALTGAPDAEDACVRVAGESGVECNVRTLSSDRDVVGSMHSDGAERLAIQCGSELIESSLKDHQFSKMRDLAEITISNCKILRLPGNVFEGLRGLKTLQLRTMNNEWGFNKELEMTFGAFNGLRELHTLDLAYNNIRKIPSDLFCALENIISLNLTRNKIKFVDELGFGHKCGSTLQTIDLSYNDIMSLPDDSEILHLRRLTQLYLQNNKISELPAEVFSDLLMLKVVNLSDNAINYLPEGLFQNTREIREIYMRNNDLEILPKRIFNRLDQLLVLDLSVNKLRGDHIEDETFSGLIRLIVLDLSHNAIARISQNMFKDLFFLQNLNLVNNSVGFIEDNAFSPLFNLHTLNLGLNKLRTIEDHMFNGLFILSKLSLNNNLLAYVSENAFKNCSDLKELDLSSNKLTNVPEAILQLPFLKSLDLGENLLTEITNSSFQNLSQLTGLRLIENQIGNLTAGMFWGMPSLQVLNLAKNKIQTIGTETFKRNSQLEAIRLDGNFISDINGVFVFLTKLLWLNLSENHLVWFDYAFVPPNLKWLDIHANFVEILGNYYKIQSELRVKTLDASHNRIVALSAMSIPNSVELLFVNNNEITTIEPDTFVEKTNLTRVDMYANKIEKLDVNSLRITSFEDRTLPQFYISANPFHCDCTMKWLLLINAVTSRQYPYVMDLNNVVCKESYVRGVKNQPVSSLHVKDFLCKFDSHCPDDCNCCDFTFCNCKAVCPHNCSCYHDATKSTNVVDCSAKLSDTVPRDIPAVATHIYLDGNLYNELNETLFEIMRKASVIYLNSSNIATIQNNTFRELSELRILHLDNNKLKRLQGLEFSKLNNLKELYLHNNAIEFISNLTFTFLGSLEILRLDGNRLVNYGLWHLDNNKRLQTLYVGNNLWSCNCKYLQGFLTYISQNVEKVIDIRNLWCLNEKASVTKKPLNLNVTVCSEINDNSMISAFFVSNNIPLLASVLTGFMLILLILALVFTFRYACRMWLYSNCGIKLFPLAGALNDADKLYDAYICYSPKDEEFVIESLARELENGYPSYHLCLHYRDVPQFEATYAQFPDLVVEATEASRRIIVVLTKNFILTEWSQMEFRQALQRALRKNPHKLIIVTVGLAPRDPELKSYLKTGLEITWKEKRFWERLRYAMPSAKRRGHKLKRLNYGRNSNTYTMDASVLNSTCQTLCGKSANSAERSPCDRPLSEHIYSTIDSDYSSNDFQGRHNHPQSVVLQHTVQTYLV